MVIAAARRRSPLCGELGRRLNRRLVIDGRDPGLAGRFLQGIVRPALVARLVVGGGSLWAVGRGLHLRQFAGGRIAPDGTERLALVAFHLPRIRTAAAFQVKVVSDCVVKKTHAAKATRR